MKNNRLTKKMLDNMFEACFRITNISRHGVVNYRLDDFLENAGECDTSQAHYERFFIVINSDMEAHPFERQSDMKNPECRALRTVLHECIHVMNSPYHKATEVLKKMSPKGTKKAVDEICEQADETVTVRITDALMPFVWREYLEIKKSKEKKCLIKKP